MEIREYQEKSYVAIQPHTDKKDEVMNWLVGLTEEVGELASLFKHQYYGGEELSKEEVAKEAGDVLWYLSALCTVLDLNLDAVADLNMSKLHHRFALGKFDKDASGERHALEQKFTETEEYKNIIGRLQLAREEQ